MFQFGIYQLDQYNPGRRKMLWGNRIAFALLRTNVPATPQQIELFECIIPHVRLSSGIYRTTFRGRFKDLDPFLARLIASRFQTTAPLQIEDWAASDCLTSCEWATSLFKLFPAATFTASDLTLHLIEARLANGSSYVMEVNGEPLQYVRPPFVIQLNLPSTSILTLDTFFAKRARARLRFLRQSWRIPENWLQSESTETLEQPPYVFAKIPLIHPDAQSLRRSSGRFSIRRHSVFEPSGQLCDVIRTMNIFNPGYFPNDKLLEGARAVERSLREGGMWIVGRTFQENPPDHNVSIFIREESGFKLLDRFGAGAEIEDLVLTRLAR